MGGEELEGEGTVVHGREGQPPSARWRGAMSPANCRLPFSSHPVPIVFYSWIASFARYTSGGGGKPPAPEQYTEWVGARRRLSGGRADRWSVHRVNRDWHMDRQHHQVFSWSVFEDRVISPVGSARNSGDTQGVWLVGGSSTGSSALRSGATLLC